MIKKIAFVMIFFVFASVVYAQDMNKIKVYYFYFNPCESCNEREEFYTFFGEALSGFLDQYEYELIPVDCMKKKQQELFIETCDRLNIPKEDRVYPMVVINDQYIVGEENIQAQTKDLFLQTGESLVQKTENNQLVYFGTLNCKNCEKTEKLLEQLGEKYGQDSMNVRKISIADIENVSLLQQFFDEYGVSDNEQQVPIIFFSGGYLSGYDNIENGLETVVAGKTDVESAEKVNNGSIRPPQLLTALTAGLVNGINPCSLSMLFFMLSLIAVKRNVLKIGLTYIIGRMLSYLLFATVFYSTLTRLNTLIFSSVTAVVNVLIVGFALVFFVLNLLDFISYKNEKYEKIKLQLPKSLRRLNEDLIKRFLTAENSKQLLPLIFLLSVVISAGEFLCTGQVFIATIVYFIKTEPSLNLMVYLVFFVYVLAMSLPMAAAVALISRGKSVFSVSETARKNLTVIKLITAVFFLIYAVIIIL